MVTKDPSGFYWKVLVGEESSLASSDGDGHL